jgi:hypothetical protein
MSVFDQKQDVVDIQLTSYGRYLLSKGNFKPEYYAFFDDDIIYDMSYTGQAETQNNSQTRLLENLFFTRDNPLKKSRENTVNSLRENIIDSFGTEAVFDIDTVISSLPLGTSQMSNKYVPSWDIKSLNGTFENIIPTGSVNDNSSAPRIPQIYLKDTIYDLKINKNLNPTDSLSLDSVVLPDGTKIDILEDYILLEINEKNSEDFNKNFEIEIFPIDNDNSWQIKNGYRKLNFIGKQNNIVDDIILSPEEMSKEFLVADATPDLVQHFFDVLVDEEIDLYVSEQAAKGKSASIAERLSGVYRSTIIGSTDSVEKDC